MDKKDLEILALLQKDASISLAELATAVRLSPTPCWRRLQKLQAEGVIRSQVMLCDPQRLNLGLTAFVSIRAEQHSEEWMRRFLAAAGAIPEIVEIYRMSGEVDYLLKVLAPDVAAYDSIYKRLVKAAALRDVSAGFAMEIIKSTTALPLDHAMK
jgi:Lrp/AsnC family transcriptional regulator